MLDTSQSTWTQAGVSQPNLFVSNNAKLPQWWGALLGALARLTTHLWGSDSFRLLVRM